eukprot:CAMPEP_0197865548 /NCGR_PEP_ID=MMETSP1438-20131217/43730_1 /TAXON_ID=1461541 /ORGANISM="Pterosperma sp., Strain CCMP1384" /LENGTH=104 /DNA_ID=CAMNT_0043484035 /DNA_START=1011 /DNA_END=1325 /DNA_ORIENTATION=+
MLLELVTYDDIWTEHVLVHLSETERELLRRTSRAFVDKCGSRGRMHMKEMFSTIPLAVWAKMQGCPWNTETCAAAAESGHLEVLQWARAEGCEWDEGTCAGAAS